MMADEDNLRARLHKLEDEVMMHVGIVKYLEAKLDRLNPI